MIKKISLFLIVIIMVALTGCGSNSHNENINDKVNKLLGDFENAVEPYNVSGMLACLSGDDFALTIQESGQSDTKTYAILADELQSDETNQLSWRKSVADGGYNYVLDLVLGTPTLTNTTTTGTIAMQTFEVWESAEGISRIKTDNGVITWQIVQSGGEWKATTMIIEYQALTAAGLSLSGAKNMSKGFGFTKLPLPR